MRCDHKSCQVVELKSGVTSVSNIQVGGVARYGYAADDHGGGSGFGRR